MVVGRGPVQPREPGRTARCSGRRGCPRPLARGMGPADRPGLRPPRPGARPRRTAAGRARRADRPRSSRASGGAHGPGRPPAPRPDRPARFSSRIGYGVSLAISRYMFEPGPERPDRDPERLVVERRLDHRLPRGRGAEDPGREPADAHASPRRVAASTSQRARRVPPAAWPSGSSPSGPEERGKPP